MLKQTFFFFPDAGINFITDRNTGDSRLAFRFFSFLYAPYDPAPLLWKNQDKDEVPTFDTVDLKEAKALLGNLA